MPPEGSGGGGLEEWSPERIVQKAISGVLNPLALLARETSRPGAWKGLTVALAFLMFLVSTWLAVVQGALWWVVYFAALLTLVLLVFVLIPFLVKIDREWYG